MEKLNLQWHNRGDGTPTPYDAPTTQKICDKIDELVTAFNENNTIGFPETEIPENADLNDYTTVGVYASINYSSTLKNCPHKTDAFKLIVERVSVSSARVRQTVMANNLNCNTYVRYLKDTWSSWKKITMTDVSS